MINEITKRTSAAIDAAFSIMKEINLSSFILFIARAECISQVYITDYVLDIYNDRTREEFYLHYLNRNYHKEGFSYNGKYGIDDLSIELMIYTHIWEADYFLKSLERIANIVGKEGYYPWNVEISNRRNLINNVKKLLSSSNLDIVNIIEESYCPTLRNAFAHSSYNIDVERRMVVFWDKDHDRKLISFKEFQEKFLYSVTLMNFLRNGIEMEYKKYASAKDFITEPFQLLDERTARIKSEQIHRGDTISPEFRMVIISSTK